MKSESDISDISADEEGPAGATERLAQEQAFGESVPTWWGPCFAMGCGILDLCWLRYMTYMLMIHHDISRLYAII